MKILITAFVTATLCGCQYDPHAGSYTAHEPKMEEIVGEYRLDQIYMESYSSGIGAKVTELPAPPIIRLLSGGTFIAERFPYFSETRTGFEYKFEDFRTISSKWSQTEVGSISDGSGTTKTHYGISVDGLPTHLSSFGFTGAKLVDGLIIGFGDPDSGDAIKYKKKTTEQGVDANPH
ncbi:MAG: hypothetical protein SH807_10975 [Blastochloris sp.]|nr:hypothetical protein [Blastochloris sp.]